MAELIGGLAVGGEQLQTLPPENGGGGGIVSFQKLGLLGQLVQAGVMHQQPAGGAGQIARRERCAAPCTQTSFCNNLGHAR
jgi:hypothetical protein